VDKVITSMLLLIAAIVSTVVVINAILPSIQRTSGDISAASDVVGTRIRSDVRIIETSGIDANDYAQIWAKNVGASNIPTIEKMDVFFGEVGNFERVVYDVEDTCPNPVPPPRTESCWQYQIENDTRWTPSSTVRITVYLPYDLAAGTEYVITIVLPTGIIASKTFTV
jgi:hypothetical protein